MNVSKDLFDEAATVRAIETAFDDAEMRRAQASLDAQIFGSGLPPQPAARCQTCRWWKPWRGWNSFEVPRDLQTAGECRRRSPSASGDAGGTARWPNTASDDFCGDWAPMTPKGRPA